MRVVVVPKALMVGVPAVKVTVPLFPGVQVPLKSLIWIGVSAGIAAVSAGPVTVSVPLSAPPSRMVALGFIAPLPSSIGLEETPFCQDIVILYPAPLKRPSAAVRFGYDTVGPPPSVPDGISDGAVKVRRGS